MGTLTVSEYWSLTQQSGTLKTMGSQLSNPRFIVFKITLACAIALLLDRLLGNPDSVSSTFVTVLCISPTVLMGVRNAWEQTLSSLIGGIWGTLATLLGLPILLGLPLAVGGAVGSSFVFRVGGGYPVAAFTALFMILVQFSNPLMTFRTRFLALFIALVSSFVVNVLISAMYYRKIYQQRLKIAEDFVSESFEAVVAGDLDRADAGFDLLVCLQQQLRQTLFELKLRKAWKTHAQIKHMLARVKKLNYLLHLVLNLAYLRDEEQLEQTELQPFLHWMQQPKAAEFPLLPDPFLGVQKRIVHVLLDLYTLDLEAESLSHLTPEGP